MKNSCVKTLPNIKSEQELNKQITKVDISMANTYFENTQV